MTDTNSVVLIGNLTRDAHISDVGQTKKADLSLAVNRSVKKGDQWQDDASYIDCTIWNPSDYVQNTLKKGVKIAISGYLKQDRWEKDGEKKSKLSVVANSYQILTKVDAGASDNQNPDIPF